MVWPKSEKSFCIKSFSWVTLEFLTHQKKVKDLEARLRPSQTRFRDIESFYCLK